MSEPIEETPLPAAYKFGQVVARVISAVGDVSADGDPYPDAQPITGKGKIRFVPKASGQVVAGQDGPSTQVLHQPVSADLDDDGYLALNGERGVWLYAGVWTVVPDGKVSPSFGIVVTAEHTAEHPLDLWAETPFTPDPGQPVTTLVVPPGGQPGQTLVWGSAGELEWQDAPASEVSWDDIVDKPTIPPAATADTLSGATAVGRSVLKAADAAAARTTIGAGTSNLAIGTTATTAMAGNTPIPAAPAAARLVPAASTTENGKVLKVNASGTPEWGTDANTDTKYTDTQAVNAVKTKPAIAALATVAEDAEAAALATAVNAIIAALKA
jgi:hypothetical protein